MQFIKRIATEKYLRNTVLQKHFAHLYLLLTIQNTYCKNSTTLETEDCINVVYSCQVQFFNKFTCLLPRNKKKNTELRTLHVQT